MNEPDRLLDGEDRQSLLAIARGALTEWLIAHKIAEPATERPALRAEAGAFVTLHVDGRLRGCLGHIAAERPLYLVIAELAVAAASQDLRFPPLGPEELRATRIEISVLSAVERVSDPERIEVGRHGLLVTRGDRRGLLLPQVAVEHAWDRETFLGQTCRKAGLDVRAWRDAETRLELFTAQVFCEPD